VIGSVNLLVLEKSTCCFGGIAIPIRMQCTSFDDPVQVIKAAMGFIRVLFGRLVSLFSVMLPFEEIKLMYIRCPVRGRRFPFAAVQREVLRPGDGARFRCRCASRRFSSFHILWHLLVAAWCVWRHRQLVGRAALLAIVPDQRESFYSSADHPRWWRTRRTRWLIQ